MLRAIQLVKEKKITSKQALDAIETHLLSRPPLGQLALEKGLMTMKQLFRLLDIQATTGEPLGQIAIREKVLQEKDLAFLLMEQGNRSRPVLHILTEMGAITPSQMLEAYSRSTESVPEIVQVA